MERVLVAGGGQYWAFLSIFAAPMRVESECVVVLLVEE